MFGKLLQPEAIFDSKCTKDVWLHPARRGAYSVPQTPQLDAKRPFRGREERGRESGEGTKGRWDHPHYR